MATVDDLQIQIEANAVRANDAIDKLVGKLDRLSTALGKINGNNLTGLANGVQRLGNAMQTMNTIRTADFTRLATNLQRLSSINVSALNSAASSMSHLTRAFNGLGTVSQNAIEIGNLAKNISKLGNKGIQNAITNIPQLANALKGLMQTLSTAPVVSRNVIQMTNALANLARNSNGIGSASNALISGLTRTGTTMTSVTKKTLSLASAFGKFYASYWLVIRALKVWWKSVESSMDYIETLNYFNAAFEQVADSAVSQWEDAGYESAEAYCNSFSERAQELTTKMTGFTITDSGMLQSSRGVSLGIDPEQLMNYQAMFAQMSNSMGVTAEASLKLSTALTEIGADLASVKNLNFNDVWTDMASGLAGMSRTLDKYGVNIRNVNLQQKLSELGIKANITALNQNDKAILRTIILLDSTRYAWGDLAETLNQPANQLRLLKSNFSNLARTIGNIFLPIVAKVLPYINMLVVALQRLAEFIVKLLGFEGFDWGGASGTGGTDFSGLIEDTEDLTDGLDSATDSAKKLKGQLQGLDELNVINTNDTSGSGGSGSSGGIGSGLLDSALDKILEEYQKAWDTAFNNMETRFNTFADNVAKAFKSGGLKGVGEYFSESLSAALDDIEWAPIYLTASDFGTGLSDFLNGLISPSLFGSVGRTIAGSLDTALYFLDAFGTNFEWDNFGNSIATGINNFFDKFEFGLAAQAINRWLQGVLEAASTLLKDTDFELIGQKIGEFLSTVDLSGALSGIADVVWEAIKSAFNLLKGLFEEAPLEASLISAFAILKFTGLGSSLATQIGTAVSSFMNANGLTMPSASSIAIKGVGLVLAGEGIALSLTGENDLKTSITSTVLAGIGTMMLTKNIKLALLAAAAVGSFEIGNHIYEKVPAVQEAADALAELIGGAFTGEYRLSDFVHGGMCFAIDLMTSLANLFLPDGSEIDANNIYQNWLPRYIWDYLFGDDTEQQNAIDYFINIKSIIDNIKEKLEEKWNAAKNWLLSKVLNVTFKIASVVNSLSEKWNEAKSWLLSKVLDIAFRIASIVSSLSEKWNEAKSWITGKVIDITTELKGNISETAQKIIDFFEDPINTVKELFVKGKSEGEDKIISIKDLWNTITGGTKTLKGKGANEDMNKLDTAKSKWGAIASGVKTLKAKGANTNMNKLDTAITKWNSLEEKTKKLTATFQDSLTGPLKKAWNNVAKSINTFVDKIPFVGPNIADVPTFPGYEKGGFPEDGWFRASHGEIMGQFDNGKSVVANNMQITEGISSAVYRGNQESNALIRQEIQLLERQNELLFGILEKETGISYKDVFKAAQKGASEYTARTGNPAFI